MSDPVEYAEQVMLQLMAQLAPLAVAHAGLRIERNRSEPLQTPPALLVDDGDDDIDDTIFGIDQHAMAFELGAFAADLAAARALAAEAHALIAADPTLGGYVIDCRRLGRRPDAAQGRGGGELAVEVVAYSLSFWTRAGDPFTAGP